MKRTKIICTMGPNTNDKKLMKDMAIAGMDVARFNFSHGDYEEHLGRLNILREVREETGKEVAALLDTKGPEIRTGLLEDGKKVTLVAGNEYTLTINECVGNDKKGFINYSGLNEDVKAGDKILIDDGLIALEVINVEGPDILTKVLNGGELGEKKGVNVPNVNIGLPSVTEQDRADIMFGCELGIDAIAASFIRDGAAVEEIRNICREMGTPNVQIFPKIESALGVKNFDEILAASNGIMVARGDLGVEVPAAEVPHIQKTVIKKCNDAYKPVITATQMLDSMIRNPRPTRAEVTDVANAIYDGTDCVMLSGESAAGKYPVEAVKTMASICKETEKYLPVKDVYHQREGLKNVNGATGFAAVYMAIRVDAKCIICPTHSGRTARLVSNFRPKRPLYAMSPSDEAVRRTCFYWGVYAFKTSEQGTLSNTMYNALNVAKEVGVVETGDIVVLTAGDPHTSPRLGDYTTSTNVAMICQVQ